MWYSLVIESKAAFARRIGVNKSNITRAAQAGRIVLMPDGRVNVESSVERWYATKGGRDDVAARHADNRGTAGPDRGAAGESGQNRPFSATSAQSGAQPAAQPGIDSGKISDRTRMKATTLHFENQSIKLEMALRRGLRYRLETVQKEANAIGATMRASLGHLVDQTAPLLAAMGTDLERRRLFDAEFRQLRQRIKAEFPKALRRMRTAYLEK